MFAIIQKHVAVLRKPPPPIVQIKQLPNQESPVKLSITARALLATDAPLVAPAAILALCAPFARFAIFAPVSLIATVALAAVVAMVALRAHRESSM